MSVAQNQELVDRFEEFLGGYYRDEIGELAQNYPRDQRSLYVEAEDVYKFDPDFLDEWLAHPQRFTEAAEEALRLYDLPIDISLERAHVRLTDPVGGYIERQAISELDSDDIGSYVALSAQLSRVTGKIPRIVEGAFICQRCGTETVVPQGERKFSEPHQCDSCERQGPFKLDPSRSEMEDIRKLKLEEPPEDQVQYRGQTQSAILRDDLCDYGNSENGLVDYAGERVVVFAEICLNEQSLSDGDDPEGETWLRARAIEIVGDDMDAVDVDEHREEIEALAARDDTIDVLKNSLAPTLKADEDLDTVLEASVAWLFNGYRASPAGRGTFRGDLHMCLIGDPGLGKSTLLSELAKIAPKSEYREGAGLSKVGLTASAVREEFDGGQEWTLKPGVLPRANGGHCIIDEVDAVVDENTKAIHGALEGEQMVKVDKADISADLPTRTALLASGNPKEGRFDRSQPPAPQIDLDPALFSRMDVIFALEDIVDERRDREKAGHYLNSASELMRAEVYERSGVDVLEEEPETDTIDRDVPVETFRAMVHYARENVFPLLEPGSEAMELLEEFYVEVRDLNDGHSHDSEGSIPATPRTLGAGIRLAVAFARAELCDTVEARHAERAIKISKKVVGLNYDPESGEFDVNRVDTGNPNSQRERRKRVKELIDQLDDMETGGGAVIEDVVEAATEEGFGENQIRHDIDKLGESGEVHFPANGEVRTT